MHYAANVLNHADMELEATQASGIVLGQQASGVSSNLVYVYAWDYVKMYRALAAGRSPHMRNELDDDGDDGAGAGGGGGHGPRDVADGGEVEDDDCASCCSDDFEDDGYHGVAARGVGGLGDEQGEDLPCESCSGDEPEGDLPWESCLGLSGGGDGHSPMDVCDPVGASPLPSPAQPMEVPMEVEPASCHSMEVEFDLADCKVHDQGDYTLFPRSLFGPDECQGGQSSCEEGSEEGDARSINRDDNLNWDGAIVDTFGGLASQETGGGDGLLPLQQRRGADAAGEPGAAGELQMLAAMERSSTQRHGQAGVYKNADGQLVAVSDATTYAYRGAQLKDLTPYEFRQLLDLRRMDAHDKAWREEPAAPAGVGRPKERYMLHSAHPLYESHILVRKIKLGIPSLAGAPPPRMPPPPPAGTTDSDASVRARRDWALYHLAVFTPWSALLPDPQCRCGCNAGEPQPALPRTDPEAWEEWLDVLDDDAWHGLGAGDGDTDDEPNDKPPRFHRNDWSDERRERHDVAAGRLHVQDNLVNGFRADRTAQLMNAKHRFRSATFWNDDNPKPSGPPGATDGDDADTKEARKAMEQLRRRAEAMAKGGNLTARLAAAGQATGWAARLTTQVEKVAAEAASAVGDAETTARWEQQLRRHWGEAAEPAHRSAVGTRGGSKRAAELAAQNRTNLPPAEPQASGDAVPLDGAGGGDAISEGPAAFAPISQEAYLALHEEWKAACEAARAAAQPRPDPPLNVEQRDAARDFFRAVQLRATRQRQGHSAATIDAELMREGLDPAELLVGPGGTGKSAIVHELRRQMQHARCGELLVTAYTGVASAPFGGPTLLALLNLGIATKSEEQVPHLDEAKREKGRKKFFEESGVRVEEVGAIVLDEVSFVEAKMLGHFDAVMRQLTGNLSIMFGGVPVLLVRAAAPTRHLPAFAADSDPPPASICR